MKIMLPFPIVTLARFAGIAALLFAAFMFGHHVERLKFEAYKNKIDKESAEVQANAMQHAMKVQDAFAQESAATEAAYQEKLDEIRANNAATARDNVTDGGRLFFTSTDGCRNAVPETATGTGRTYANIPQRIKLPPTLGTAVLNAGSDADYAIAIRDAKIAALQDLIRLERQ